MAEQTHYPNYDVMDSLNEWDPLTQEIVVKRKGPFPAPSFLQEHEVAMLRTIAQHLIYDNRKQVLDYIVHHFDEDLTSNIGESYRKSQAPPADSLVREGLQAIDKVAQALHGNGFLDIDVKDQFAILASLQLEKAYPIPEWSVIPQKSLFDKLLELTVSAYYSHPTIWSEIGYGGPAYPRGYYRIELGWRDPWEAKRQEITELQLESGDQ